MAAELLDIEAKLDTSQVQGQLSQLSKTSGLQNLDRAIKTLESSMKRLSQTMDRQAQQMANGGGNGTPLIGGRALRGLGGFMIGRTASAIGDYASASGNTSVGRGLKTAGTFAQSIGAGAAVGGMLGGPAGAAVGASVGALQAVFSTLADTTRELNAAMLALSKDLKSTNKAAERSQSSYLERMWQRQIATMSGSSLDAQKTAAQKEIQAARRNEAIAQAKLAQFQTPLNMSLLESGTKEGQDKAYVEHVQKLQEEYARLVEETISWADKVKNAEGHLSTIEKRQDELARAEEEAARKAEKLAKAEEHLAQQREKLRNGYAADLRSAEFQQKLESLRGAAQFGGMSQEGIKSQASQAAFAYNVSMNELNQLRKEAMSSGTPEEYESRIKAKETEANEKKQLADMWQSMIDEPAMISLSEMMSKSVMPAVGNLNSLEQAGYFGMASQDKTIEDLTQQILNYVRRITANTETQTSTNDETFGNY